jgi:hypothetical protein
MIFVYALPWNATVVENGERRGKRRGGAHERQMQQRTQAWAYRLRFSMSTQVQKILVKNAHDFAEIVFMRLEMKCVCAIRLSS